MIRGMYAAAAGALVAETDVDTIADNLANATTGGFKKSLLQVQASASLPLERMQTEPGRPAGQITSGQPVVAPIGPLGLGAEVFDTPVSFAQGTLRSTGNPYDLAVNGDGFFTVQTPQGLRYTRNGSFTKSAGGLLVTSEGNLVLGKNGAIALPDGDTAVGSDGTITVDGNPVDQLRITSFAKQTNLRKLGASLYGDLGAKPQTDITSSIVQGKLENSNSDVVHSMVDLITAQRWFEANEKAIETQATATTQAIQTVGNSKG